MDKRTEIISVIKQQGLMPLYFHASAEVSIDVLKALYEGGCRVIEYTNRGKEALKNFEQLKKISDASMQGMYLGAGTIKDGSSAIAFINAGADFLVSPGLAEDVFDATYSDKILWIPGCMTITEIMKAEQFGIELIKLFPGSLLGPSYVQAIREIFPNLLFMPTGGVELEKENLSAWFKAGVCAVGMGSKLISKETLEKKEYEKISALAKQALGMIRELKKI
ncbi:MAG: bifunctional 4-hydroxy-2-oxoglutarate aldolase/2-dehydro-3-deoxy-phosphogluconate aldolase [Bacteroidetes bacterium]|nr:bifunctional 4-hydroxy-2-oxoglutarate aldolase/2-dehydro-3-deoxy-phosphogluconate aldolase [Bacteroidota bacterium]